MKKILVAIFLLVLTTQEANAIHFIKSVSSDFDDSIFIDVVAYCLDKSDPNQCIKGNMKAAFKLFDSYFKLYDSVYEQQINICEKKYYPDYQKVEICLYGGM